MLLLQRFFEILYLLDWLMYSESYIYNIDSWSLKVAIDCEFMSCIFTGNSTYYWCLNLLFFLSWKLNLHSLAQIWATIWSTFVAKIFIHGQNQLPPYEIEEIGQPWMIDILKACESFANHLMKVINQTKKTGKKYCSWFYPTSIYSAVSFQFPPRSRISLFIVLTVKAKGPKGNQKLTLRFLHNSTHRIHMPEM